MAVENMNDILLQHVRGRVPVTEEAYFTQDMVDDKPICDVLSPLFVIRPGENTDDEKTETEV